MPKVKIVDRSYSESAPAGAIIAQDPPEGKRIPENGALLVSVSKGSAYADVPSVAGLEGAAAFALLERKGFTPTRRYAPSTEIEAWHAVETDPRAREEAEAPGPAHARRLDRPAEAARSLASTAWTRTAPHARSARRASHPSSTSGPRRASSRARSSA